MKTTYALCALAAVSLVSFGAVVAGDSLQAAASSLHTLLFDAAGALRSAPGQLWLVGLVLLASILIWHLRLRRAIAPAPGAAVRLPRYPSVTVIRPVRGRDVGAEENFRAALDTGYPGEVETLFIFDDDSDPGLPLARSVVADHHAAGRAGQADVLVAGAPPPGRTGKLNAMIAGTERARGELIAFGDSDTRPDREVLRQVVETLAAAPDAGSAFAPILVDQPARAAGDALYALMQNALYAPLAVFAAGPARQLPFIMGQLMVFRRSVLAAIGGVACAEGQLVDDMYLGRRLHEAGYRNLMSRHPLRIATGGMTFAQFIPVYRRWLAFSRNGLPLSFTWRQWLLGLHFVSALALSMLALVGGYGAAALPATAALFAVGWSQLSLQHEYGGAPIPLRLAWTAWAVFLIAPAVIAANALRRDVSWRGRVYRLDTDAALAGLGEAAA
jgi:ceramide glucosyltransferase